MEDTFTDTSLSISCVTFNSDADLLEKTIDSIANACQVSTNRKSLSFVDLYLIDNGSTRANFETLTAIREKKAQHFRAIKIISGQGNIGYGRGNNLAINESSCNYHLILNPDVLSNGENIQLGIHYLEQHPDVGMVAPSAFSAEREPHFIAKRHPTLTVLLARALKLKLFEYFLKHQLDAYEYRDKIPATAPLEIELASGCYMLCRTATLKEIGGFDPRFFMYFEDFDLCIKLRKVSKIIHLPDMQIIHMGGNASRKGWKHIFYFCTSLIKFYLKH